MRDVVAVVVIMEWYLMCLGRVQGGGENVVEARVQVGKRNGAPGLGVRETIGTVIVETSPGIEIVDVSYIHYSMLTRERVSQWRRIYIPFKLSKCQLLAASSGLMLKKGGIERARRAGVVSRERFSGTLGDLS